METIIQEIKAERMYQEGKWGQQNHPILDPQLLNRSPERMCEEYEIPSETRAKGMCDMLAERKELIQVAAVAIAMIESLDRNGK